MLDTVLKLHVIPGRPFGHVAVVEGDPIGLARIVQTLDQLDLR